MFAQWANKFDHNAKVRAAHVAVNETHTRTPYPSVRFAQLGINVCFEQMQIFGVQ